MPVYVVLTTDRDAGRKSIQEDRERLPHCTLPVFRLYLVQMTNWLTGDQAWRRE